MEKISPSRMDLPLYLIGVVVVVVVVIVVIVVVVVSATLCTLFIFLFFAAASTSLFVFQAHVFERTKKCSAFVHRSRHIARPRDLDSLCKFHSQLHGRPRCVCVYIRPCIDMCVRVFEYLFIAGSASSERKSEREKPGITRHRPYYVFLGWPNTMPSIFRPRIHRKTCRLPPHPYTMNLPLA